MAVTSDVGNLTLGKLAVFLSRLGENRPADSRERERERERHLMRGYETLSLTLCLVSADLAHGARRNRQILRHAECESTDFAGDLGDDAFSFNLI